MRKVYLPVLIFILILSIIDGSFAGDRTILVERFTSSTCGPCASNNPTMDAFLNAQDPSKIRGISYHMSWPAPGNDPMYLANTSDNNLRRTYYNVNAIPQGRFDGFILLNSPYNSSSLQTYYNDRSNTLSEVNIVLTETRNGNTVNVKVDVYPELYMTNPTATAHFAILEKTIQYSTPPGTNGESVFHDVMRKMLPNASGTTVSLIAGQKITLMYTFEIDPAWNAEQIEVIFFLQASNTQILNAAAVTKDFNLISRPAYGVVNSGQNQNRDFKVYIPQVASNFNSTVNFSAEVYPSAPGISISFPNGSTLSNFPDSLALNVSSSSSVTAGEYMIVITGTSTDGKTHKTIVNYLVDKNYVLIKDNFTETKLKVDGTEYSKPVLFLWDLGSQHLIEAISPQTFGSTRYVFDNWSNGGSASQNVTIGAVESNYELFYKKQFRLISSVAPTGIPVTVTGGNEFYDSSAVANISLSETQVQHNGKTYYFQRWEGTGSGSYTGNNPTPAIQIHNVISQRAVFDTVNVGISNYSSEIPEKYNMYQNYPNPFNPVTKIKFDIPASSLTSLTVYDNLGREVAVLVNEVLNPGKYEYSFDAVNLPSGVYFYRIEAGNFTHINKMILLK